MGEIAEGNGSYRFDGFELKPSDRLLLRGGERVPLTPRQFDLLLTLLKADGHLVSKETLLGEVWADAVVEEGNLNRTISSLRKSLGEKPNEHRFIETVPKTGYRFVAPITRGLVTDSHVAEGRPAMVRTPSRGARKWMVAAIAIATLGCGIFATYLIVAGFRRVPKTSAKKELAPVDGPLRLTDNPTNEDQAEWTRDGHIRFIRFIDSKTAKSVEMDADGANQRLANYRIGSLQTGLWSPDGRVVIFRKSGEPSTNVYLANADGTGEEKLPFDPVNLDWSRDGRRIVYQSNATPANSDIFIYNFAQRSVTNISRAPTFEADPAFSPDGKSVAFVSDRDGNQEIYLMKDDGTDVRRLTNHPAREAFPVFSPDGTQLLFDSNRENETVGIYLMNVNDASPPIRLTDGKWNDEHRHNCWSPDGTQIVFTSDRSGKDNVYRMAVEPSSPQMLLADDEDLRPGSFSPDGTAFVYQARGTDESELRIYDLSSKTSKVVLSNDAPDLAPVWSPKGDLIAFNCKNGGNTDICTVRLDGSELHDLTDHPARDSSPTWSPDGTELIFTSDRDGEFERPHLFRIKLNEQEPKRITNKEGYEMLPAWSHDGSMVAFACDRVDRKSQSLDIYLISLTEPFIDHQVLQRPLHDAEPVFSPDGRKLAFVAQGDGNSEIYLMNTDGSGLLRLTRSAAEDTRPQFSPDGNRLIFASNRGGKFGLYTIELSR